MRIPSYLCYQLDLSSLNEFIEDQIKKMTSYTLTVKRMTELRDQINLLYEIKSSLEIVVDLLNKANEIEWL